MSNIPTGLSGEGLSHVAEVEALKTQLEQLKKEVSTRDGRIVDLSKQSEDQDRQIKQLREEKAAAETAQATALAAPAAMRSKNAATFSYGHHKSSCNTCRASTRRLSRDSSHPVQDHAIRQRVSYTVEHITGSQQPSPHLPPLPTHPHRLSHQQHRSPHHPRHPSLALAHPPHPLFPSASSGKVIAALTSELSETKSLLESTRAALTTVRTQSAAYQAAADEMRSTLSRARLENDSSVTILARKDRQISEALERARKAETESKELGRASREWGTRIREVEEELGKERMKRSRAEQAYEMLGNEWKTARGRLVEEVRVLKEEHKQAVDGLAGEYQKVLVFKDRLKQESALLATDAPEGDVVPPTLLVSQLTSLNDQMQTFIQAQMQPLLARLKTFEARENAEVVDRLQVLTDELTRIKTLMRRGDVTSAAQVGPSPL